MAISRSANAPSGSSGLVSSTSNHAEPSSRRGVNADQANTRSSVLDQIRPSPSSSSSSAGFTGDPITEEHGFKAMGWAATPEDMRRLDATPDRFYVPPGPTPNEQASSSTASSSSAGYTGDPITDEHGFKAMGWAATPEDMRRLDATPDRFYVPPGPHSERPAADTIAPDSKKSTADMVMDMLKKPLNCFRG